MALDATQVRVGLTGHLYAAPVATTMPADATTALAVAWKELGYVTEDGITIGSAANVAKIMAWQTQYEVRRMVTSRDQTFKFKLMQRNTETLKLAMGGGAVTVSGAVSTYTPPVGGTSYERAFVFEVDDGSVIDRWLCYRGVAVLSGDVVQKKDEASVFDLEVGVLADATGNTWTLLSSDVTNLAVG